MKQTFIFFTFLVIVLTACNRDNIGVQRNSSGGIDVTIRLNEAEVNTIIQNALNQSPNPLLRNPSVDLQYGQIIISGEHDRRDGQGRVSGNMSVQLSTLNGAINTQVLSLNIEGFDANNETLALLNNQLQQAFQNRALRDNPAVTIQSINTTDNAIEIILRLQGQNN